MSTFSNPEEWTVPCLECEGHGETRDSDGGFDTCFHPGAFWNGAKHVVSSDPDQRLLAAIFGIANEETA
jgi:hypothetical protein